MTDTVAPPPTTARRLAPSSYVGLVPYAEEDAEFFFGCDEAKRIVTGNLRASRPTILTASSGVGKTSLLRAGSGLTSSARSSARTRRDRPRRRSRSARSPPGGTTRYRRSWRRSAQRASRPSAARSSPAWRPGEPIVPARAPGRNARAPPRRARPVRGLLPLSPRQGRRRHIRRGVTTGRQRAQPTRELRASIREDALAKLDRFEGRIPALFANYLRVEHLDRGPRGRRSRSRSLSGTAAAPGAQPNRSSPRWSMRSLKRPPPAGSGSPERRNRRPGRGALTDRGAVPPTRDGRLWRATVDAGARTLDRAARGARGRAADRREPPARSSRQAHARRAGPRRRLFRSSSPVEDEDRAPGIRPRQMDGRPSRGLGRARQALPRRERPHPASRRTRRRRNEDGTSSSTTSSPSRSSSGAAVRAATREAERRSAMGDGSSASARCCSRSSPSSPGSAIWALVQRSDARRARASATSLALASAADKQLGESLRGLPAPEPRGVPHKADGPGGEQHDLGARGGSQSGAEAILRTACRHRHRDRLQPGRAHARGVAGGHGTVVLWDVRTNTRRGQPLNPHLGVDLGYRVQSGWADTQHRGLAQRYRHNGTALGCAHARPARPFPDRFPGLPGRHRVQPGRAHARRRGHDSVTASRDRWCSGTSALAPGSPDS